MLKFLACASALAIAAPAVAQDGPETPMADPVMENETAVDASADAPMDEAVGVDAETDVRTTMPEPAPGGDANAPVTTDAGDPMDPPLDHDATEMDEGPEMPEEEPQAAADPMETGAASAQATQATTADPGQIEAWVDQQFASRDADGSGELSQDEFTDLILPIFTAQAGAEMTEPELDAWAEAAFAQTDTDGSAGVSSDELIAFLTA